jgi:hypothetical protein
MKSWFIRWVPRQFPLLPAELPDQEETVGDGEPMPELQVVPVGVARRSEPAHGDAAGPLACAVEVGGHASLSAQSPSVEYDEAMSGDHVPPTGQVAGEGLAARWREFWNGYWRSPHGC